ncbi:uncharacterized protein LOC134195895 [Corticium candelabrum]|uniref:uncharacterized protein LOC134195895 n=1 Tax=Corticium candelabrum TaxID=121492 RepID=UPI002E26D13D|nr:uncharacterized protein LOC134195895 [Corticium candelabrum]
MASVRGFSLKHISKIIVSFCTFNSNASSVRELLRRVSSDSMKESNPKCIVETRVVNDESAPTVQVKFVNGEEMRLNGSEHHVLDMMKIIKAKSDTMT